MHENAQKKNLIEKHLAKLRALSHSMVKVFCGKDAFSEILRLEASPVIGQSLPQKDHKRRKRKGEEN